MRTEIIQPPNYYKIGIIAWFAILLDIWPDDGLVWLSETQTRLWMLNNEHLITRWYIYITLFQVASKNSSLTNLINVPDFSLTTSNI